MKFLTPLATCAAILLAITIAHSAPYTACGISSEYKHSHWAECAQQREEASHTLTEPKSTYDLRDCMVYIPDIKDPTLRNWCLTQSKRLP